MCVDVDKEINNTVFKEDLCESNVHSKFEREILSGFYRICTVIMTSR